MTVNQILQKARNTLQDQKKNFWDDSELLDYYEQARRVIASERTDKLQTQLVVLSEGTEFYSPTGVLRYISAVDDSDRERKLYSNNGSGENDNFGITVIDSDKISVHDDSLGTSITLSYLGLPVDHNLNDEVRSGDEEAIRYFILARAYEKETDMENFQKSQLFDIKFKEMLVKLVANASAGYRSQSMNVTKTYSY